MRINKKANQYFNLINRLLIEFNETKDEKVLDEIKYNKQLLHNILPESQKKHISKEFTK